MNMDWTNGFGIGRKFGGIIGMNWVFVKYKKSGERNVKMIVEDLKGGLAQPHQLMNLTVFVVSVRVIVS